jgi:hypothetical protein
MRKYINSQLNNSQNDCNMYKELDGNLLVFEWWISWNRIWCTVITIELHTEDMTLDKASCALKKMRTLWTICALFFKNYDFNLEPLCSHQKTMFYNWATVAPAAHIGNHIPRLALNWIFLPELSLLVILSRLWHHLSTTQ